nr:iron chelate uptake ABC transporter family permease subunit [Pseudomonadota bacterium]
MALMSDTALPARRGRISSLLGLADLQRGDRAPLARAVIALLAVLTCLVVLGSLAIGPISIPVLELLPHVPSYFAGAGEGVPQGVSARDWIVLMDIRLPRVTLGALIGAALAVSGAVMQGLFRNPLADPGIVGVSAGAGLGA